MQQDDIDAAVKPTERPRFIPIRITLNPRKEPDPSHPGVSEPWMMTVSHAVTGEIIPVASLSLSMDKAQDAAIFATITVPVFALDVSLSAHVVEMTGDVTPSETIPAGDGKVIRLADPDRFRLEEASPCAACGMAHPMLFTRLDRPYITPRLGLEYTHAGPCPRSCIMVYMIPLDNGRIFNAVSPLDNVARPLDRA